MKKVLRWFRTRRGAETIMEKGGYIAPKKEGGYRVALGLHLSGAITK